MNLETNDTKYRYYSYKYNNNRYNKISNIKIKGLTIFIIDVLAKGFSSNNVSMTLKWINSTMNQNIIHFKLNIHGLKKQI